MPAEGRRTGPEPVAGEGACPPAHRRNSLDVPRHLDSLRSLRTGRQIGPRVQDPAPILFTGLLLRLAHATSAPTLCAHCHRARIRWPNDNVVVRFKSTGRECQHDQLMSADMDLDTSRTSLPATQGDVLRDILTLARGYLDKRAVAAGAVWPPVRVLLADDFAATVQGEISRRHGADKMPPFGTTRMGGTVAAKTIWKPGQGEQAVVVIDSSLMTLSAEDAEGVPDITRVFIVVHELCHVLIAATRHESGVLDQLPAPEVQSERFIRGVVEIAVDEYRADRIAADAIGEVCWVATTEGERCAASVTDTVAVGHLNGLAYDLSQMYPALPDLVDQYRRREVQLLDMWDEVQRQTTQAFNLLAHAQAVLDSTLPAKHNILLAESVASRASDLYFRDGWRSSRAGTSKASSAGSTTGCWGSAWGRTRSSPIGTSSAVAW